MGLPAQWQTVDYLFSFHSKAIPFFFFFKEMNGGVPAGEQRNHCVFLMGSLSDCQEGVFVKLKIRKFSI